MRVEVNLPDWVDERNVRIFAGIEEVAHRYAGKKWQVKKVRCNLCGKCCMDIPGPWIHGRDEKTGYCKHLKYNEGWKGWLCDMGRNRPFACSGGDFSDKDSSRSKAF